jgi:hypothetical protein
MKSPHTDLPKLAAEWLHYEAAGAHLRHAHRCPEWDGWEEGLIESILGPADQEEDWIREARRVVLATASYSGSEDEVEDEYPTADDVLKPHGMLWKSPFARDGGGERTGSRSSNVSAPRRVSEFWKSPKGTLERGESDSKA